jgi:hypothetical protein
MKNQLIGIFNDDVIIESALNILEKRLAYTINEHNAKQQVFVHLLFTVKLSNA